MSGFKSKIDCIILKFEAKTEWSDFSFVNYCIHKKYLHETETADELNDIHSLPAGGA